MTFARSNQTLENFEPQEELSSASLDEPMNAGEGSKNGGFEMWLGSHLNKIGVIFLVSGLALLIINQFQYFTPVLKIMLGLF